ncbi:MAG: aminotransferase class I/II-fold pyridoxal phosphate-dependent enzyme [Acidimicrobiia bacterium]|nr:aminotransferase class I/II-fold pyridoxal phosphate-dependent enzyme [Acidimicrobiia bacterium]
MSPILLSPPDVGDLDREALLRAFDSNWIAPLGPEVDGFEKELADAAGTSQAAALNSGTAGLHLALLLVGVRPGDHVVVPTLTFAATANAVTYVGAVPRFVDAHPASWNLDPDLVAEDLHEARRRGIPVGAVIAVDLYGRCADYERLEAICARFEVPLIEDAAESLGASYRGRPAGSFGAAAVFSFNGNKILTTSGGGALVSRDASLVERARFLSSQARQPELHYEHHEIGFNYRMSNLLAALGRSQLAQLDHRVAARTAIADRYRRELAALDGVSMLAPPDDGTSNNWLSVITLEPAACPITPTELIAMLAAADIESRPAWKPMHRQPVFGDAPIRGGAIADAAFAQGVCLPSGSALTESDQQRVISTIRSSIEGTGIRAGDG